MDDGDIIPDVAYGNRNYRIVRKRDSNNISPLTNIPKRSAKCMREPDGPIHKYTVVNGNLGQEITIVDGSDVSEQSELNRRDTIEMDDISIIGTSKKVESVLMSHTNDERVLITRPTKTDSVYHTAQSSPERSFDTTEVDLNRRIEDMEAHSEDSTADSKLSFSATVETMEDDRTDDLEEKRAELRMKSLSLNGTYKLEPDLNRQFSSDHLFFTVSSLASEGLPSPYPAKPLDDVLNFNKPGYVQLPWSTQNMVGNVRRYVQILRSLQCIEEGMNTIHAFPINVRDYANLTNFDGLIDYYETLPDGEKKELLETISGIAKLALRAEQVITKPIPYLTLESEKRSSSKCSVTLSQEQCACLLANAFFCTFPERSEKFGIFSMERLFSSNRKITLVKLQFIFEYFKTVLKKMPDGVVSIRRVSVKSPPDFEESTMPIPLIEFANGKIENYVGALQVDFANRYIGGGVLGHGAVQEEIMFLQRPEMMVSILLCPRMNAHEAIFITGAQQYSSYSGYAYKLKWVPIDPETPIARDKFKRINHEVVAIDAKNVSDKPEKQYEVDWIDRELRKCYAGFKTDMQKSYVKPIATGNWGCGVFGGDLQLKAIIQLVAAGTAGRELIYVAFNEEKFCEAFRTIYKHIRKKNIQIGVLYGILSNYEVSKTNLSVFEYVMECLS